MGRIFSSIRYHELDRLAELTGGAVSKIAVHHMESWFDLRRG